MFSENTPLNLSTKPYSSSMPSNTPKSFLNYPFASLLSLATHSSALAPSFESSSMHSAASSPMKDYSYNRRQRERTTFDPHEETPRLLQIFTDTKHPTRYQIASICESLNALPCRKGSAFFSVRSFEHDEFSFRKKSLGTVQYSILVQKRSCSVETKETSVRQFGRRRSSAAHVLGRTSIASTGESRR